MSSQRRIPNSLHENDVAARQRRPKSAASPDVEEMAQDSPAAALQRVITHPEKATPGDSLALQRTAGNRAVRRLIQARLMVGPAGDSYEQEADRVAEQIMTMPAPAHAQPLQRQEEEQVQAKPLAASITRLVQRQASPEEEELQAKPVLQRANGAEGFEASREFEERLNAQRSGGSPLPEGTRSFMESRFGVDFSGVRIHADSEAAQLNREVSAQAFTYGQDIFIGEGQYSPHTSEGQWLLAHELTHVVQQAAGGEAIPLQRQGWEVAGVALAAASFAVQLASAGAGGFNLTNAQFRYAREQAGPHEVRETTTDIIRLRSIKGLGSSWAFLELVLRYDGHNIISAYTRQGKVEGYEGGALGSEAGVTFGAVQSSGPTEPVTQAYLTFEGFNNPSGPGFQRFSGRILVTGDGRIERSECRITSGTGEARPWLDGYMIGWFD